MQIRHVLVVFMVMIAGCSAGDSTRTLPSQLANDPCAAHDQASCSGTCEWIPIPCADGQMCATGVCVTPDACRVHGDQMGCNAAGCAWAAIAGLCPAGADCNGSGFCYTPTDDGCACACPAACPPGEMCPPCQCDCTGGGTTCTCETPACPPGQMCPPSTCDCGGSGCSDAGTCTCACPVCEPGKPCPPCDCACSGGGSGGGSGSGDGMPIPAMTSGMGDPCTTHTDKAACSADMQNACGWFAVGAPCMVGQMCQSGVCQHVDASGGGGSDGDGCGCVCPACAPGEACPPCNCGQLTPGSGGGTGGGTTMP